MKQVYCSIFIKVMRCWRIIGVIPYFWSKSANMARPITEEQTFKGIDYNEAPPLQGTYEYCQFINCSFANVDLAGIHFVDSVFEQCDLSLAKTAETAFRTVSFRYCKMLGLRFEDCNQFLLAITFTDCSLNFSTFFNKKSLCLTLCLDTHLLRT